MPRKDLEWIKEKGLDSDKVIEILTAYLENEKIELEGEPEKEPKKEEKEPDKVPDEQRSEIEIPVLTEDDIKKIIHDEVKSKYKIVRKTPPEGKQEEKGEEKIITSARAKFAKENFEAPLFKKQKEEYEKDL